jgi:hypothetical protein
MTTFPRENPIFLAAAALTLAGSRSRLEVTEVGEARLRDVTWISIRAAGLQDRD